MIQKKYMKNNIKVAIIGFGKIGKTRYKILNKFKNIEVLKIYDPYQKIPKNLSCPDVNDIFSDKKINSIFICTPNYLNAKYTCSAG